MYAILVAPFIESEMFWRFETVHRLYTMGKLASFLICGSLLLICRKKLSKFLWSVVLFQTVAFACTVMNTLDTADLKSCILRIVIILGPCFVGEYFLPLLKEKCFSIARNILFILVAINLYTIIAYPQGLQDATHFFLGLDNRFILYTLPLVCLSVMYSVSKKNKLDFMVYASIFMSLFSTIATWAVGGFLGMIVLAAGILLFNRFNWFNKISTWFFFLTPQITSIMLTVIRFQYLFRDFIVKTLQKDITFTGRTLVWDRAINLFLRSPIIGIGNITEQKFRVLLTTSQYGITVHVHNDILDHACRIGIFGMITYFLFWAVLVIKVNRINDNRIRGLCNVAIFTQLFMAIADTLSVYGLFYLTYIYMYHYSDIFERHIHKKL